MKIGDVTINNFLTIGEAAVNLSDRGLVLIQGKNVDDTSAQSNGAGKSSILDALSWGFFGVTARGETADAVINDSAGKNCQVQIDLIDEKGVTWRVSRHRKHATGKNTLKLHRIESAVKMVDESGGTDKITQDKVSSLLGCSVDVFCAAVYAGQDAMPDLPSLTDKYLKVLVEEAAGVDRLQAAFKIAKERQTKYEREFEELQRGKEQVEERLALASENVKSLAAESRKWESEQKDLIKRKQKEKKDIEAEIAEAKSAPELTRRPNRADFEKHQAEALADLKRRTTQDAERAELQRSVDRAASEHKALNERFADAMNKLKKRKAEMESVDDRLGDPCRECGKPITKDDLVPVRAHAKDKARDAAKAARELKERVEAAIAERTAHASALEKFDASAINFDKATRKAEHCAQSLAELDVIEDGIKALEEKAARIDDEAIRIQDAIASANPFTELMKKAVDQVEEFKDQLGEAAEQRLSEAESRANVARAVSDVYGPAGVRAHILDSVTPFLNDRTAHYLGSLSDGNLIAQWSTLSTTAKGELREKFQIKVTNAVGAKSFKGLSGGEKRKVRLGCAMALQDLVASRAAKPIDLFMADEIDHALDEAGLERLMGLLDEKARSRGTVLVVSHNALDDWISNVTTVTKKGGSSTIDGALCS